MSIRLLLIVALSLQCKIIQCVLNDYCISTSADANTNYGIDLGVTELDTNLNELRFLAVGDWGQIGCIALDCNVNILSKTATAMNEYSTTFNPAFVLSVGDHFYQNGIESENDPRWKLTFEDVFDADILENIYWYISLGNHDWSPNKINYNLKKPDTTYDDGTNAQIMYTTSTNNKHKRWCLPSYYYTFAYKFTNTNKTIRFISIDTIFIQYCRDGYDTAGYCHGASIPNLDDFWIWFYEILDNAVKANEFIVIYTHYNLVSNGNYGLKNANNDKCTGIVAENEILQNLTNIVVEYGVNLYISGHEHNSDIFYGVPNTDIITDDSKYNDEYVELLVGSFGKTNGNICGNYSDIKQQYKNSSIEWNMIYGTTQPGFGSVMINGTHLYVSIIGENKQILSSHIVQWNHEYDILNTTYFSSTDKDKDNTDTVNHYFGMIVVTFFVSIISTLFMCW